MPFWEKAVRTLGEATVAEELGELKYQMQTRHIKNPAKYLTTLLKKQITATTRVRPNIQDQHPDKLKTYFENTQLALFTGLKPLKEVGEVDQKTMIIPYGKETIPWATFISSSFFTLSTNKDKSDKILAKFRTLEGGVSIIPLLRGRIKPGDRERGIPTAEHGKILAAIESIWVQQGSHYDRYASGAVSCYCYVSIRELAKLLGWKTFGGKDLIWLTSMVYDLKTMPYYLDLTGLGFKNLTGYGFSLLSKVELAEGKKRGQIETILKVDFSTPLSVQLIDRHAVSRPKELPQIRGELAFLIRLYLEPILISLDGKEYSKTLKDLVKELSLPFAKWHKLKDMRHRMFEKAIKEMKTHKTTDGKPIIINIQKGLYDWVLVAHLGGSAQCIELKAPQPATQQ